MTAGELITKLQEVHPDSEVHLHFNDTGDCEPMRSLRTGASHSGIVSEPLVHLVYLTTGEGFQPTGQVARYTPDERKKRSADLCGNE